MVVDEGEEREEGGRKAHANEQTHYETEAIKCARALEKRERVFSRRLLCVSRRALEVHWRCIGRDSTSTISKARKWNESGKEIEREQDESERQRRNKGGEGEGEEEGEGEGEGEGEAGQD